MSLHVLVYNLKRVISLFGVQGIIERMQTAASGHAISSYRIPPTRRAKI